MNLDDLTIGEIEAVEDITGASLSALEDDTTPKGKTIKAIVYIVSRRLGEPKSLEEIAAMPMTEAMTYMEHLQAGESANPA